MTSKYAQKTANIISKVNSKAANASSAMQDKISSVANVGKKVALVGGAVGGAAVLGAKSMIEQASSLEQYRNTLNVVMKDQTKAAKTFKWASDFANKTPFETDEIVQATVKLTSYGLEAQKVLPMIGDMAGVMGKSVDDAVEAVADAQSGELERLKEFGITKQQIIDHANKIMRGKQIVNNKGQITDQTAFNKALFSLMNSRFKGGMDLQANSFNGLMSTVSGIWKTGLAKMAGISDSGDIIKGSMFDIVKQKVAELGKVMTRMQSDGTFDKLQKKISQLTSNGLKKLEQSIPSIIKFGKNIISNAPQIISSFNEGISVVSNFADKAIKFGSYLSQNGPGIINIIKSIRIGFLAWKAIEGISNTIIVITNLRKAIATLRAVQLASTAAKSKDILATIYLQGLYAKDAIIAGLKTAGTWAMVASQGALNVVTIIGTGIMSAFGAVLAFLTSPIGLVVIAIGGLIAIGALLYNNWDSISKSLVGVWQNNVLPFFSGLGSWFSGVFSSISSGFNGVVNWVVGGLNKMIGAVNSLKISVPDWVPGVGGKTFGISIPSIPAFAKGGFTNRPSIFGEAGLEAAIPIKPKNPRSISLLNRTAQLLGVSSNKSGGGNTYVFAPNIQGNSAVEEVKQMLQDQYEQFKEFIERYENEKERLAYE